MKHLLLVCGVAAIWLGASLAGQGCSDCPDINCVEICTGAPDPPNPNHCPLPHCMCDGGIDGGVDAGQ